MFIRTILIFLLLMVAVKAEKNEKFFQIKLNSCSVKKDNSKFKDPNFYHPISFDINFNKKIHKKPINLIKACTIGNKLIFILNDNN